MSVQETKMISEVAQIHTEVSQGVSVTRKIARALLLCLVGAGVATAGLYKSRVEVPALGTERIYTSLDEVGEKVAKAKTKLLELVGTQAKEHAEGAHHETHKILVTSPMQKPVTVTQPYVCQIHSQRHINLRAMDNGYLEEILVKEGQLVKKGDPMFRIIAILYQAKLDAELAEAELAQLEYTYTKKLVEQKMVSQNEILLLGAKLAKAQAKANLAKAELSFTNVTAPFDGIVDRLHEQLGSLIKEGDILTTLSDNSLMWVYFNVPERDYLEYMDDLEKHKEEKIELMLANGKKFEQEGKIGAIEAKFNNETGNIPFRADFPNPDRLLRHGQTGTILIHRVVEDAVVIPQRATFENLAKRYVYVVDEDDVVHQREIIVEHALEDIYVVKPGILDPSEKIVLEGMREIHDGEEVKYDYHSPEEVLENPKNKAE